MTEEEKDLIGYDTAGNPVYRDEENQPGKHSVTITKDDLVEKHGKTIADVEKARERQRANYQRGGRGVVSPIPEQSPPEPPKPKPKAPVRGAGGEVFTKAELAEFKTNIPPPPKTTIKVSEKAEEIKPKTSSVPPIVSALPIAAGVAIAEPTPLGEVVVGAAVLGILGYTAATNRKELANILKGLKYSLAEFKSKLGRNPTAEEILVVNRQGQAATLAEVQPKLKRTGGVPQTDVDLTLPGLTIKDLKTAIPGIRQSDINKALPGTSKGKVNVDIILPTPKVTMDELTGNQAGLIKTAVALQEAEETLKQQIREAELPSTRKEIDQLLDDLDKTLQGARSANKQELSQAEVFKELNEILKQNQTAVQHRNSVDKARQDYLRILALYEKAMQSHVAMLNPQPVQGNTGTNAKVVTSAFLANQLNAALNSAITNARQAYNKALDKTGSVDQATAAATQAASEVVNKSYGQNLPASATETLAQTIAKTSAKTATATTTATAAKVTPATATPATATTATAASPLTVLPATTTPATPTTIPPTPIPPLPKKASDDQKRAYIKSVAANGAFAWRGGELQGKDIWHVVVYPYKNNAHYFTLAGKLPEGVTVLKRGKGSAYATAQMVKGIPPDRTVRIDQGFQDIAVSRTGEKGIKMKFTPDPKLETKGDISIGTKRARISNRLMRLSGRGTRISDRMPRLR